MRLVYPAHLTEAICHMHDRYQLFRRQLQLGKLFGRVSDGCKLMSFCIFIFGVESAVGQSSTGFCEFVRNVQHTVSGTESF